MTYYTNSTQHIQNKLNFPCGVIFKNRLTKSLISGYLGGCKDNPTEAQIRLYERWVEGGVALSIFDEVQVDFHYPEKLGNLLLGSNINQKLLKELTSRAMIDGTHLRTQLGHAETLSLIPINKPMGP